MKRSISFSAILLGVLAALLATQAVALDPRNVIGAARNTGHSLAATAGLLTNRPPGASRSGYFPSIDAGSRWFVDGARGASPTREVADRGCRAGACHAVQSDPALAVPAPGAVLLLGAGLLVLALGRVAGAAPPWRGDLPGRAAPRAAPVASPSVRGNP